MTININNYEKTTAGIDWDKMPKTLRKVHESLIKETIENDWEPYKVDEDIKGTIDMYFEKLAEYLAANPGVVPKPAKKAATKKVAPAKKASNPKKAATQRHTKKKAAKKVSSAKSVEHIDSDVRFIQRYVAMHGRHKTRKQLLGLLQGLQKAIVERRITKDSPYAAEIGKMEDSLKACLDAMGESITVELAADSLENYRLVAGSEKVSVSVQLLKAYISLAGKPAMKERAEKLHKRMAWYLGHDKIKDSDRYYGKLQEAFKNLAKHIKSGKGALHIEQYELNGLAGIGTIKRPGRPPGKKKARSVSGIDRYDVLEVHLQAKRKTETTGLGTVIDLPASPAPSGNNTVYSGAQIVNMRFDSIGLQGKMRELIGDPAPGFKAMIYGKPKQGKSTFAMMFAKELAKLGRVKYCALEEGFSLTLKDKLVRMGANVPNLYFSEDVGDVGSFKFVVIDSVSEGKFDADQLKALTRQYPKIGFIYVFHATKGGNFRGGQQFAHDVDVIIRVDEGVAYAQGRFAPPAEINIEEIRKAA